jgi:transcriptional regulator with XRE-family HTH domain
VRPSAGCDARSSGAVTIAQEELAGCMRSWRERLTPAEAGLPAGRGRRTPGLRREEVAGLAGVSLDYLARLEQGRAQNPSPSVLASLARALRLTDDERSHLFRLAGHVEPGPGTINRHITPSLQRLLDRLAEVPVMVIDAAGEIVAANPLANALMGDVSGASRRERTIPWRHFSGIPSRLERTPEEHAEAEEAMAADLRDALGRFPDDEYLNELIRDLRELSPRFAELWEKRPVAHTPSRRKSFNHPEIGTITLDCDALAVQGSDLSVIVYTAPAGSPDAEALARLGRDRLQSF